MALPDEASQVFVAVWQQAIYLAQGVAEQVLAEQRQVLSAERERVTVVEDQTRLADLELMLAQYQTQIEDL